MDRTPRTLVIDARPRGPRGLLAVERVRGQTVLDRLFDLAESVSESDRRVPVHVSPEERETLAGPIAGRADGRFYLTDGLPPENAAVLRTDRIYDPARLRRALRKGADPGSAVIWRLDQPQALEAAGEELTRRQTYQPLGRYWALDPARWLARILAPTRVRPNAVTLAAAALMLAAAGLVAFGSLSVSVNLATATMLALALVLDTADGHLARIQGTATAFGRWLDAWLDELCDMALHAAIAWAAFTRAGAVGWLLVGMAYAMGKYVFVIGSMRHGEEEKEKKEKEKGGEGRDEGRETPGASRVRNAIRMAGHADVRWHLWIALAAIGRLDVALAAYAVYFPARSLLGAVRKAVRRG